MMKRKQVRLIKQKTGSDCAVCSMAMLTGIRYRDVYRKLVNCGAYVEGRGMNDVEKGLIALGLKQGRKYHKTVKGAYQTVPVDFKRVWTPYEISIEYHREQLWGRRALLSVPSLNNLPNGMHMIYWHYDKIFDPSPKKIYTEFQQLKPKTMYIFMEK